MQNPFPQELAAGISAAADSLGASATLGVDLTLYSITAVFKAAYWFTDRYYLYLYRAESDSDRVFVEVRSKDGDVGQQALLGICSEFANALTDQEVRQRVLAETGDVRNALVRRAFGEGRMHGDPDALCDPHEAPGDGCFESDPLGIRREGDGHAVTG